MAKIKDQNYPWEEYYADCEGKQHSTRITVKKDRWGNFPWWFPEEYSEETIFPAFRIWGGFMVCLKDLNGKIIHRKVSKHQAVVLGRKKKTVVIATVNKTEIN